MTIEELNLISSVRSKFSFLENEFGFHLVREDPATIRYESDDVFVSVSYEPVSFEELELSVTIALLDQSRRDRTGYSIDHLIRLACKDDGKRYHWPTARTQKELERAAETLAEQLRAYGGCALRGDVNVFNSMYAKWEMDGEQRRVQVTRPKAEAAFRGKDFLTAVELYDSMEGHRTAAEEQKLTYARKRCARGNTS